MSLNVLDIEAAAGRPSFCVIVPMYNEEDNTERCIRTIHDFLSGLSLRTAIIAVDDGSSDRTGKILTELSARYRDKLIVERHSGNRGYGAANMTGSMRALKEGFDYALFMDADLTQDLKYVYPFIEEMKKGTDFIKATRYSRRGGVEGVPFKRWIVSWVGNLLARAVLRLPLSDYTNGFRAVKVDLLARIRCTERGFAYLIEEVCQLTRHAKTYADVPYILTVRQDNASKSKFNYSPNVYWAYLRHLFRK